MHNQNTHFIFNNLIFRKPCSIRDNVENMLQPDRLQTTIRRMPFACWITKATDVQLENILFIAFPRKKMVMRTRMNVRL